MDKVLQIFLRRLTNLTSRNRSLFLPRIVRENFIDFHDFDYLVNKASFELLSQVISNWQSGKRDDEIMLFPEADSRDEQVNEVSGKLKRLQRKDWFLFEEQGARDLNLGWPFVQGKFNDGTVVRAPLLFFPVSLKRSGGYWKLELKKEMGISFNKNFVLAYAYFNNFQLSEELLDFSFDDFPADSHMFRTELYNYLKESGLEIQFNRENFVDRLYAYGQETKSRLEDAEKPGVLKLYPQAVLGIFPQAGSYLVPDYLRLMEQANIPDLEAFLQGKNAPSFSGQSFSEVQNNDAGDGKNTEDVGALQSARPDSAADQFITAKEEKTFTPFWLDAYQEEALKRVKTGQSLVVQGPPGTGKSQLICNLVSDYMARGKKVLVVCQKKAALDVVNERLKDKGMGDFAAMVADFKSSRKSIYQQIGRQIDALPDYQRQNKSLDAIYLEREYLKISRRIGQITEELEAFRSNLFDDSECGKSPKELYLISNVYQPSIGLKYYYRFFPFTQVDDFIRNLRIYADYYKKFGDDQYPLFHRLSFAQWGIEELRGLQATIEEVIRFRDKLTEKVNALLGTSMQFPDIDKMWREKDHFNQVLDLLSTTGEVHSFMKHIYTRKERKNPDIEWINEIERYVLDCYKGLGPESSVAKKDLGRLQEALDRTITARKNPLGWIKWELFSEDKYLIKRVLVANNLSNSQKGLNALLQKVDNRLNLEHHLTKLREQPWMPEVPDRNNTQNYSKVYLQNWFYSVKNAVKSYNLLKEMPLFTHNFNVLKDRLDDIKLRFSRFSKLTNTLKQANREWETFLKHHQIHALLHNAIDPKALIQTLKNDFESLCEFDSIWENFTLNEKDVTSLLLKEQPEGDGDKIISLFTNSLALAWLDHLEMKYPVLRSVASNKMERMENELQEAIEKKHELSQEILLMKVREKTYENVEYNRLGNLVTYRDLYHQVNKKRKIWPLRKLVHHFADELFYLIPCWLTSPESVSAIFPLGHESGDYRPFFDLVIYDEASQCFAEKGIPALYRGQQIVVAGDDKQLQPNDLYEIRWEEEEADKAHHALDVESLLELSAGYMPQVQLLGHYRSQSYELIDFSNRYFYNGKLKILPSLESANRLMPAIGYHKINGIWHNNQNKPEADKVIEVIENIHHDKPNASVGIITFNIAQQQLVRDEIEKLYAENRPLPDDLIIKNIENVQGDEKDVIVFSTGYAPDKNGKMVLKFGSLNIKGGENRLNVAITRAREEIHIVTSMYPEELKVEKTANEGPKLLKAYLDYAKKISEQHIKPEKPVPKIHSADWYLGSKLSETINQGFDNLELVTELPFSDLTLKNKHENEPEYLGLVNTDDELYFQSYSAKEAHAYHPMLLSQKKWSHTRFYSRAFWANPEEELARLKKFVYQVSEINKKNWQKPRG